MHKAKVVAKKRKTKQWGKEREPAICDITPGISRTGMGQEQKIGGTACLCVPLVPKKREMHKQIENLGDCIQTH